MKNVFVYGSLKKGLFNHSLIGENPRNKLIRKGFVIGYKLYILWSYPAIKLTSPKDKVFVELYSLTDEVFEMINRMEISAGYTPIEIEDDAGEKGLIYVYDKDVKEENIITFGNWTKNDEKLNIANDILTNEI